jgi:glycosyltransferase involved in cell wall biosynthesis
VLIVTYTFPPFGTVGHTVRLTKFARYLPSFGWRPTVLTIADDDRLRMFERNSSFLLSEIGPDVEVVRTKAWQPNPSWAKSRRDAASGNGTAPAKKQPVWWRLHRRIIGLIRTQLLVPDIALPWIPTAIRAARKLGGEKRFDVVLASIPLNSNGVAGAVIARVLRAPLIIDVRDDWVGGAYFLEKGWFARTVERWLERFVFNSARAIVLVSELSLERYRAAYPRIADRFTFIPNGFDLADLSATSMTGRTESRDRVLLVHSGMTGPLRTPVPLFRALRDIIASAPPGSPRFELVMAGELLPEYVAAIRELGLEQVVTQRAYLPTDEYLRLMSDADVLVAISDAGYSTEIPGKLYTHWAAGRPSLLIADPGAGERLVATHRLGWTVAPTDHSGLVRVLAEIRDRKREVGVPPVPRGGLDRFDRRRLTEELAVLLGRVVAAAG